MSKFSRGQKAQISKRVKLFGKDTFTAKEKKCLVGGHKFWGPGCNHTVEENQEVVDLFKA